MIVSTQDREFFSDKLFMDKDFEFLNNYDSEIKNLEKTLELQKMKKEEISEFLEKLRGSATVSSNLENYESFFTKLNAALKYVDENIRMLSDLQADLTCLDKEIVNFMLRFEKGIETTILEEEAGQMKSQINFSSRKFSEIQNSVFLNDIKIDTLINQLDSNNIKKEDHTSVEVQEIRPARPKTDENTSEDIRDNNILLISEKKKTVYLPYTKEEIVQYYEKYSKDYSSYKDVIRKQFILPLSCFNKAPAIARFREGYTLERDIEAKSIFEALKFGLDLMFKSNLYPAIIPACKTEDTLSKYLQCLDNNSLNQFNDFQIRFEMNPLKT